ncbi:MAG: methyltransferase domain-containing protein [Alphaproteobacteria bacterium]
MSVQERFYRRGFERWQGTGEPLDHGDPDHPSHRYHAAWRAIATTRFERALEIGYGVGSPVDRICGGVGTLDIVDVVDISAAHALPTNCRAHIANLDDPFPFPDAHFDCALAMMVVEHLYDPFAAFAELARVLRPGAPAFVNLPNIASVKNRWLLLTGRMPVTSSVDWFEKREWDGNHLHYFTIADVRRLAEVSGLSLTAIHPVGRLTALKRLWPGLLCHEITFTFVRRAGGE